MAENTVEEYGRVRSSGIEQAEYETALKAKRIMRLPSNQLMLMDKDGGSNPIYVGYAAKGVAQSASGWTLHKFDWDASNDCTSRGVAYDAWDDRASASYT